MTPWDAALARLDADGHLHAGRFRALCDEHNPDREQRDGYRDTVVRLVAGTLPPSPAPAVSYGDPPPARRGCCGG